MSHFRHFSILNCLYFNGDNIHYWGDLFLVHFGYRFTSAHEVNPLHGRFTSLPGSPAFNSISVYRNSLSEGPCKRESQWPQIEFVSNFCIVPLIALAKIPYKISHVPHKAFKEDPLAVGDNTKTLEHHAPV